MAKNFSYYFIEFGAVLLFLFANVSCLLAGEHYIEQRVDSIRNIVLDEVSVVSRVEKLNSENNIVKVDSAVMQNITGESLSELLSKYANITIKAYGVSGISSLSIRGAGTSHTAVVWNGFNLQDQLNGGFNFALAPAFIADNIDVKYGGSSAIFGSGAMGGTISMSNNPYFNSRFGSESALSLGSFGKLNFRQGLTYGNGRLSVSAKGFYSKIDNDFTFTNKAKPGFPTDTLRNAAVEQFGLLFDGSYKLGTRQMLSAHLWTQNNSSEVPPNMVAGSVYAQQYDSWNRLALDWQVAGERISWNIRNGTFYSYLNYINNGVDIDAVHKSLNNISEIIADVKMISKSSLELAVNNNFTKGNSDNFTETEYLNRLALFASFKTKLIENVILNLNIREEMVSGEFKPVTFGLFSEYSFSENYFLNSNISKNNRTPTFNDLYWKDAYAIGNPDLRDEVGYSVDISAGEGHSSDKVKTKSKITGYFNSSSNLVQWVQVGQVWTTLNRKKVDSYGAELSSSVTFDMSKESKLALRVNYTYTNASIVEKAENESDDILFKQLIYTPYHQGNVFANYTFKKFSVALTGNLTGKQFTRSDNSDSIPTYFIVDLITRYKYSVMRSDAVAFLKIKNLLNTDYMQMQWYPMPPLNFEVGVTFSFK